MTDAADGEGRMRLTVVGGFLGSGKTTWLRHQLHAGYLRDAYVIVNEAAETPVDDALLGQSADLEVLAGGCACCDGLSGLLSALRRLCDRRSQSRSDGGRLERIVLETSGLADPAPIVQAIRADPLLVHHIVVSEIIVAVDALNAAAHLRTEALGRRQVEIADRLLLTKVDAAPREDVVQLMATLARLNPGADLSGTILGSLADLPDATGVEGEVLPMLGDGPAPAPIFPTRLKLDDEIDWTVFAVWLSALLHARGDDVLRVKGVIRTPAGRLLLQSVRRIVQSPEILPSRDGDEALDDDMIVVIGRGYRAEDLSCSLKAFAGVRTKD